jgi:hypothetical protein
MIWPNPSPLPGPWPPWTRTVRSHVTVYQRPPRPYDWAADPELADDDREKQS